MVCLQYSASQFFVFLLFTFVVNLAMLVFFRMLSSVNRAEPNATLFAGLGVLVVAIYVGYAIPRPSMRVWFRWLSYAQPVSFGFESLLANEFRTLNVPCVSLIPSYPGIDIANQVCSGTAGATAGSSIANGSAYIEASFGYKWSNAWRNFGFIWVYFFFFMAVNLVSYEFQRDESSAGGVMLFNRGAKLAPEALEAIEAPASGDEEHGGDKNARPDIEQAVPEDEKDKAADTLKAPSPTSLPGATSATTF